MYDLCAMEFVAPFPYPSLAVPETVHGPALRAALVALPSHASMVWSTRVSDDRQHLFTDEAGVYQGHTALALASWSIDISTTNSIVAGGPLPGLAQTVPGAELTAVLVAIAWSVQRAVPVTVWSDALNVVRGVQQLIDGLFRWDDHENLDLWLQVQDRLQALDTTQFQIRHVPSHLDESRFETQ